jgi:hypothetical protein
MIVFRLTVFGWFSPTALRRLSIGYVLGAYNVGGF